MQPPGYITAHIDLAQLMVAAFLAAFVALVLYLRREDKREGYPLEQPQGGGKRLFGFPAPPLPKVFTLLNGGTTQMPHTENAAREIGGVYLRHFPGAPLTPVGNPLLAGVGPGSFALRKQQPLLMTEHKLQVVPLRDADGWRIAEGDADPVGMTVLGADRVPAGVVRDIWIDRSVKIVRYLEVELAPGVAVDGDAGRTALLPIYHADVKRRSRTIRVRAIVARKFADVPRLAEPNRISAREEDQVNAYYAAGAFYAESPIRKVSL